MHMPSSEHLTKVENSFMLTGYSTAEGGGFSEQSLNFCNSLKCEADIIILHPSSLIPHHMLDSLLNTH